MPPIGLEVPISAADYRALYRQQIELTCTSASCNAPGTTLPARDHFGPLANAVGLDGTFVEIGVRFGDYALMNLEAWRGRRYVMIDPEQPSAAKRDEVAAAYRARGRQIEHHVAMDYEVADRFANRSLDVVYIDAGHAGAAQREYLARWWPKLKPGGILCGDDYVATKDTLLRLWREQRVVGPWVGTCVASEERCKPCVEQCRSWRLLGKEHRSRSGVVRAVAEFARVIRQPVGVGLAGRPVSESHMPINAGGDDFASAPVAGGAYWKRCELPGGCAISSSAQLGHYRSVRHGDESFDQPQFFFVKPLDEARARLELPAGWGRHRRNCHRGPASHMPRCQ